MATEPLAVWQASRRQALAWLGSACWASAAMAAGLPAPGSATLSATLWAAWQDEGAEHIGEVRLRGGHGQLPGPLGGYPCKLTCLTTPPARWPSPRKMA